MRISLGPSALLPTLSVAGPVLIKYVELQPFQGIPCKVQAKLQAADLLANARWILETAKPFVLFQRHKLIPARGLLRCSPLSTTQPAPPRVLTAPVPGVLQSKVAADPHGDATASHEDPGPWRLVLA